MSEFVHIFPCSPVDSAIRPPGSKSITNRAIICAALARGTSTLTGVLDSEDTQVMIAAWKQLGLEIDHDKAEATLRIEGCGGNIPKSEAEIFVANSGTTIRFLAAALSACEGDFVLDGIKRMRKRPIEDLLLALRQLGADIASTNESMPNCPPVHIRGVNLSGGPVRINGGISSQYLSGLMMASPLAREAVQIQVDGELVSVPYVKMTAEVMRSFGAVVTGEPQNSLQVAAGSRYKSVNYAIEPDASAASYFWGAAAITGGSATVNGLSAQSLQGDVGFCRVLEKMGCEVSWEADKITVNRSGPLKGVDVNMADISDTVQTLAAVAMNAQGATRVTGVAHNRVKETDRISDLARELRKFGAEIEEFEDGLAIQPPPKINFAEIETYNDHRMAMSLALVGLVCADGVRILNPKCTGKTYPQYWEDLESFSGCRIDRSH